MERITYRITLDTHRNGIQRTLQGFETADTMSRRIAVNLVASGDTVELPLSNVVAMMYITTPSATEPSINACKIDGNTIIYDVLPIVEEGITEMQLKVIETDMNGARKVLVSPRFAVEVTESGTNDDDAEQSVQFTALEDAIARADAVYNSRLVKVEIGEDCTFRVYYADGTVYENDYLNKALYNGNALLSESFAHGGTGIRDGEATDNSKYYSLVSKSASIDANLVSEEARTMLDEARLQTSFTSFNVNFKTGNLDYLSANYYFDVNEEDGNLEVENDGSYNPEDIIGSVVDEYIAEKTSDYNRRISQNATDIESLNESVEVIREDISTMGDDVEAIKEDIFTIEQGLQDTNKNVQSLFGKDEELEGKDADIEGKLNQLSNPNQIINANFQVWQEGESFSLDGSGIYKPKYTSELWYVWQNNAMEITKVDNGLKIDVSVEQRTNICQVFEKKLIVGETYTLSAKINGEIHTMQIVGGTYKEDEHLCYMARSTTEAVGVCFEKGTTIIEWVKLEQGSVATPFVPRTYQEEWIACQRYYQKLERRFVPFYYKYDGGNHVAVRLIYDYPMRSVPTIVKSSSACYDTTGNWQQCNNSSLGGSEPTLVYAHFYYPSSVANGTYGVEITFVMDSRIY